MSFRPIAIVTGGAEFIGSHMADLLLSREFRVIGEVNYWREAPLWDPASIERATKTWFTYLRSAAESDQR